MAIACPQLATQPHICNILSHKTQTPQNTGTMKFTAPALVTATLILGAVADFEIYVRPTGRPSLYPTIC